MKQGGALDIFSPLEIRLLFELVWKSLLQPLSPILVKTILKMVRVNLLEMHSSDYGQLLAIYRQDLFSK